MALADITGWNPDASSVRLAASLSSPRGPSARPLKILHILDHSAPVHSGYAFRSQNILHQQRERGWLPVALTSPKHAAAWKLPATSREEYAERERAEQERGEEVREEEVREEGAREEIDGVRYYRTAAPRGALPWACELQLMAALAERIERVARREKPDLLHAHSPVLNALPALWAGRNLGLPVVYEVRAFWEDAAANRGSYSEDSAKYRIVRSLETWAARRAAHVAVISDGLREDLAARGVAEDNLSVIANGTNPEIFHPRDADPALARRLGISGKKVIGFIGSFNRYEGLDLLVRAAGELAARWPEAVVLLAGGGEMEPELRAQIARSNLQDQVLLAGRVAHENIPALYSLMEILVYPRYSMRLTERVTPLKPLEAMAMARPVIASNVGGHRELLRHGETGILFEPGNLSSLVQALDRVLADRDLRTRLAARAREWVLANRTWKTTTAGYSEIYSRALNACRGIEWTSRATEPFREAL